MGFWDFAHQHPLLIGFCVLFIAMGCDAVTKNICGRGNTQDMED